MDLEDSVVAVRGMNAAIWTRVSTDRQETDNQLRLLRALADQRGYTVVAVYEVEASATKGQQWPQLNLMLEQARRGEFGVLLVWAIDRLSRGGPEETLRLARRVMQYGSTIVSLQESWVEAEGPLRELLLAIMGWVAQQETARRSERTKAGMERARADGKHIGRPKGAKDSHRRKRTGYFVRHDAEWRERNAA